MRTVQLITAEAEKIVKQLKKHYKNCKVCQQPAIAAKEGLSCTEGDFLNDEYFLLRNEAHEAEAVFQQELKERNIKR